MSRHVRIASILLLAAITVCVAQESVSARTYYVRKRGNDRSSGTSRRQAFKTLSRALQQRLTYGDTVYVGAGTYTRSSAVRSFASASFGGGKGRGKGRRGLSPFLKRPLRIVADTTGRFTGDRGAVVIAAANRWAVTVANNTSVQFEGVTFGSSRRGGRYYGVYGNGASASVTTVNCRFQNVYYGVLVYSGTLAASNCDFVGNVYGAYGSRSTNCTLQNCRFNNVSSIAAVVYARNAVVQKCSFDKSKYGVYVRGVDRNSRMSLKNLSVFNCTYGFYGRDMNVALDGSSMQFRACAHDIYLNRCNSEISRLVVKNGRRPLTLVYGTASIRSIKIQESQSYGIYAVAMDRVSLTGSQFGKTPSWAAYLHGRSLTVSDCQFDQSKNGLLVRGVNLKSEAFLTRLTFKNCNQGLYCQTAFLKPVRDNAIVTSGCNFGVVLNRCRSALKGFKCRSDTRPLSVYGGQASLARIDVTNAKSYGVYTANMEQLDLTDSRFNQTGSWAVHAHGRKMSISDSTFNRTKYGLYVRELSKNAAPVFRNMTFNGCTYGLRCDSSAVRIGKSDRLAFSDCVYAVTLIGCRSTLRGMDVSGAQRPISLHRGTASVDGLVIRSSKSLGLYSSTMDRLSVTNSRFGATGSWAIYAHGKNISVSKSTFSGSKNGLYVRETSGKTRPVMSELGFSKCAGTGLRVVSSAVDISKRSNIRVDKCGYGIYLENCTSNVGGLTLASSNIPLYVSGGKCNLDGVTIEKAGTYGLLAYKMLEFSGKNLKCSGARSWGFYGYGRNFSLSDSTVSSCGHGIYVDGQGTNRSIPLANVSVQDNSGYGLYVKNASFHVVPKSTLKVLRNRGTGLFLAGKSIDLDADSGIEISDNGVGVYANRTDVKMSGFKLKGNGYGLLQYYGKLECRNSVVSGGRYGIYQVSSPECLVENTTISGASKWGMVVSNSKASSQNVTVKDSKLLKCGGGLNATMLSDGRLDVSGSTIEDNRSHGVYSWRANCVLTKTSVARNRGYGIIHYDGSVAVTDSTIKGSGSYGLMAYGYRDPAATKISARRNRITDNGSGIYAFRVDDAEIVNNVAARNRSVGIAVSVAGRGTADVWNNSIVDSRFGVAHYGGNGTIRNNVIAYGDMKGTAKNAYGIYRSRGSVDVGHNLLFGQQRKYVNTTPGAGDVLKPPRFIDYAKGDFRLAAGSPAINAGTSPGSLTSVDIQGLSRPMFDAFEIGAFEYPEKSGSVRILDWGEMASPPKSMLLNGRASFKSLLN